MTVGSSSSDDDHDYNHDVGVIIGASGTTTTYNDRIASKLPKSPLQQHSKENNTNVQTKNPKLIRVNLSEIGKQIVITTLRIFTCGAVHVQDVNASVKSKDNVCRKRVGNVNFGGVRVHTHNLTLGQNPGCTALGPPLELEWEHVESFQFSSVESFAIREHGRANSWETEEQPGVESCLPAITENEDGISSDNDDDGSDDDDDDDDDDNITNRTNRGRARRLGASERQQIAARNHSRNQIRRIQKQCHDIRKDRLQSKLETLEEAEKEDQLYDLKGRHRKVPYYYQDYYDEHGRNRRLGGILWKRPSKFLGCMD